MADEAQEAVFLPFTAFNFRVEIEVPGVSKSICRAAFSEVDGLEATVQVRTIREGGDNTRQIHLNGPVSYGQVTLKRGMTANFDLWEWFDRTQTEGSLGLKADAEIVMLAADRTTPQVRFVLEGCRPVKLRAPALNALDGLVAIEEMQLAYERLRLEKPAAAQSAGAA